MTLFPPKSRAKFLGAPPILACLHRSVGHCRKPSRQGCLRSQELCPAFSKSALRKQGKLPVCPTLAPRYSFFQGVSTRPEGSSEIVAWTFILNLNDKSPETRSNPKRKASFGI